MTEYGGHLATVALPRPGWYAYGELKELLQKAELDAAKDGLLPLYIVFTPHPHPVVQNASWWASDEVAS